MKSKRKLLVIGGAAVAIVVALTLGVPVNTLLLFGAALLCPAMMLFGRHGMGDHQCEHGRARGNSNAPDARHRTEDSEGRKE